MAQSLKASSSGLADLSPSVGSCPSDSLVAATEQRKADLKLLEAPDIGTGVGGKPKVLVPKAVDADEEGDDDDDDDSESDDDEVCCTAVDGGHHLFIYMDTSQTVVNCACESREQWVLSVAVYQSSGV